MSRIFIFPDCKVKPKSSQKVKILVNNFIKDYTSKKLWH